MDTGSTGRHTNLPDGFDFDFSMKLNEADFKRVPDIVRGLQEKFGAESFSATISQDGFQQYVIK